MRENKNKIKVEEHDNVLFGIPIIKHFIGIVSTNF